MKFHAPTIEDAKWAVPLLEANNYMASEYAFTNVFMWQDVVDTEIDQFNDFPIIRVDYNGDHIHYQYPSGTGEIKSAIDKILEVAQTGDRPPLITAIPNEGKELLENLYPDKFNFTNPRGNNDYVYLSSDLADLPGSKFRKKRNHCSHFLRSYPDWEFKEINEDNISDITSFTEKWLRKNEVSDSEGIEKELKAIKRALNNYVDLGLRGGYLTVDEDIVAYSYGKPMGDEFITHVEKARYDIHGAYAFINREMAKKFGSEHKYINREDDVGEEGLRKAKMSYRPVFLIDKWQAEPKVWPPQV